MSDTTIRIIIVAAAALVGFAAALIKGRFDRE